MGPGGKGGALRPGSGDLGPEGGVAVERWVPAGPCPLGRGCPCAVALLGLGAALLSLRPGQACLFLAHGVVLLGTPARISSCCAFSQIVTSASTDLQDYTYYFVPAPWLSVKLLRLLQCYPPPGNSRAQSLGEGLLWPWSVRFRVERLSIRAHTHSLTSHLLLSWRQLWFSGSL